MQASPVMRRSPVAYAIGDGPDQMRNEDPRHGNPGSAAAIDLRPYAAPLQSEVAFPVALHGLLLLSNRNGACQTASRHREVDLGVA
jgi:hypothetical protein